MYARVARWEGSTPEELASMREQVNASPEPPPGVPATGYTLLTDAETGRSLAIALFDSEEDMRTGDATLNGMSPDPEFQGRRVGVEFYEVAADLRLGRD